MIPVSQPFLPPKDEYFNLLTELWDSKWLTNHGKYVQVLEEKLLEYLNVSSIHFVTNGTIALQLAIKSLNIKNEIITTPFSFVATTTSILWENCEPVFVDIDPKTLNINPNEIEKAITPKTEAILATHVYGIPCDIEKIGKIAKKYNLKVIYDAAHAFGVRINGTSLLSYGDISTISFHATKLFHTVEGGAVINNSEKKLDYRIRALRNFGIINEDFDTVGINGKNSEMHAAMGLCNLKYINQIIECRKTITEVYDSILINRFERPFKSNNLEYNYAYYPIIFETEKDLLKANERLKKNNIESRRYFHPSLNKLPYLKHGYSCPISENISKRILCLPLYSELLLNDVQKISNIVLGKI